MNEKLNLVEVLKDCPKGMPLDCTMFDNVTFVGVNNSREQFPIEIAVGGIRFKYLTKEGCFHDPTLLPESKCVIFPKGKTTWEGFQRPFKDGDILYIDCNDDENTNEENQYTFILKEISDGKFYCYCYIDEANIHKEFDICLLAELADMRYNPRFATKEEKQRLFDAIKANGYKWNAGAKTLEKLIVPKFKVGDSVQSKIDNNVRFTITNIDNNKFYYGCEKGHEFMIPVKKQDNWELMSDDIKPIFKVGDRIRKKGDYICGIIKCIDNDNFYKVEYSGGSLSFVNVKYQNDYELVPDKLEKSIVPKFKVGDKIRHKSTGDVYKILFVLSNGYGGGVYDVSITNEIGKSIDVKEQDDYELVPNKFDISTLIPYESKVLIRSTIDTYWQPAFWGAYINDPSDGLHHHDYLTTKGFNHYCIPYDGNEHLIGKTDDCCDFYKTWEE